MNNGTLLNRQLGDRNVGIFSESSSGNGRNSSEEIVEVGAKLKCIAENPFSALQ